MTKTSAWTLAAALALVAAALLLIVAGTRQHAGAVSVPLDALAIDVDTSGNDATTLGTTEVCASINNGDTIDIDVVVRGIPPYSEQSAEDGISAFGLDLLYDQTVLQVTDYDGDFILGSANTGDPTYFESVDARPDTDGDFNFNATDLSQEYDSGSGVLVRITLEAIGTGTSTLVLDDVIGGDGVPNIGDANSDAYDITDLGQAEIAVGTDCGATPTPVPTPTPSTPPVPTPTLPAVRHLWGDANCDGVVNAEDAAFILASQAEVGGEPGAGCFAMGMQIDIEGTTYTWGDFDCSGSIDVGDALAVLLGTLGLDDYPDCPAIGSEVFPAPANI